MSDTSRRKFLAAAGVGAAAAPPPRSGRRLGRGQAEHARGPRSPCSPSIDDHRKGTVRLLVGEREVVVHDRDLATRLLNAAGGN